MEILVYEIEKARERGKAILYCGVGHRGHVLMDRWFEAVDPLVPLPVFSVSKTVSALLIGKALEQGHIPALNTTVRELLPEYGGLVPEKLELVHILTMSAGFDWPENATFGSADGVFRQFLNAAEPARFVLERERVADPGKLYAYNSGLSHLLMVILERVTCINPVDYCQETLWEPLGIPDNEWSWLADQSGIPYGGHGLSLTAEGMNRLGELMLGKGKYKERQLISTDYMEAMASVQIKNTRGYEGYGFQTWIGSVDGNRFWAAFGHGGQRIYLFPELELQVVFLGRKVQPEFGLHERIIKKAILAGI